MSDTFITVITVMVLVVIMFVVPLMGTAKQNDSMTQTAVQSLVSDFVNTSAKEGKITRNNYENFIQKLYSTGNSYNVELEVRVFDVNPIQYNTGDAIGENIYYSEFTSTIVDKINSDGSYNLSKGSYIKARVENTNVTMGTILKNFIFSVAGRDTIAIEASESTLVNF